MDIYLSESRINVDEEEILDTENIKPGGKSICRASVQLVSQQHGTITTAKAKLDSCGSVSIAHGNLLNHIKPSKHYKLPNVRLRGIGGKTNMLKEVGILQIKKAGNAYYVTSSTRSLGKLKKCCSSACRLSSMQR
jgi:hypothetical protein